MPKNYDLSATPANAQRRREHARDDAWIRALLERAQVGHVATRWDDQPFITPTTFWYDEAQNAIIFHSNVAGRIRANADRHPRVCFSASEAGRALPSNVALDFSFQYRSVIAFGTIRVLADQDEQRRALYGLIEKYFPTMTPGQDYRPITDQELARTSVYAIMIESWSGKENWKAQANMSDEWPPLPDALLEPGQS
jgi:nitroimidazol reductase NimA-like FMN-containing flavoprotein (pyridoxamine 5'-phosphate oxidase superfamily)